MASINKMVKDIISKLTERLELIKSNQNKDRGVEKKEHGISE